METLHIPEIETVFQRNFLIFFFFYHNPSLRALHQIFFVLGDLTKGLRYLGYCLLVFQSYKHDQPICVCVCV